MHSRCAVRRVEKNPLSRCRCIRGGGCVLVLVGRMLGIEHALSNTVGGAIGARYNALGADTGPLGDPVGNEYGIAGGRAQDFEHGRIYAGPSTGAWETYGLIAQKYQSLGGPAGVLGGRPAVSWAHRTGRADSTVSYRATSTSIRKRAPTASTARFSRSGDALATKADGSGFPSDEYAVANGRQNDFQDGWIRWVAATGRIVTS